MKFRPLLTFLTILIGSSCAWTDSQEEFSLINGYKVSWYDLESNRNLNRVVNGINDEKYIQPLITDYIFEIGYDSTFIIAKTHPKFDTTIVEYYVVNTLYKTDLKNLKELYGPMNKVSYESLLNTLEIDSLNNSIYFNEIPRDFR